MVPQPGRFQHPRPISTLHSSVTTSLFTQLRHPERPKVPGKWCHIGVTCSCYSSLWVAGTSRLDCGHFAPMTSHWVIKDIYRLYMIILYCSMSQQGLVWAFAVRSNTKLCVFHLMVSPLQACMSLVSLIHPRCFRKKTQINVWIIWIRMLRSHQKCDQSWLWASISSKRTPAHQPWPRYGKVYQGAIHQYRF